MRRSRTGSTAYTPRQPPGSGTPSPGVVLALVLVVGVTLLGGPVRAAPVPPALSAPLTQDAASAAAPAGVTGTRRERAARRVLARAQRLLAGSPTDRPADPRRRLPVRPRSGLAATAELTPVLHELFLARRYLSPADRRLAQRLLARPTDGGGDPYGDGYTTASRQRCGPHVCVHWVPTGPDAPRSPRWVRVTLAVMEHTWRYEIDRRGYLPPLPDGTRGGLVDGTPRFDVYLADVGSKGYYGYCAAEAYASDAPLAPGGRLASGYCVLDNDFARWQFHARPLDALRVTAGHEFFHAIQYGYDVDQDRWLSEATATWMEDQIADRVDDNRQFLPAGQLGRPGQPLDVFAVDRYNEYGNWFFFAYLSQRFGRRIVRDVWEQSSARAGGAALDSVDAVRAALRARGTTLASVYAGFAAAALTPRASFDEGRAYRPAPVHVVRRLSAARPRSAPIALTLRHLTSRTVRYLPRPGTRGRLRVSVRLPDAAGAPAARVTLRTRSGIVRSLPVRIGADRRGSLSAPFSARRIAWVAVTVVNASARYRCDQQTSWTCRGTPLDDAERSVVRARLRGR